MGNPLEVGSSSGTRNEEELVIAPVIPIPSTAESITIEVTVLLSPLKIQNLHKIVVHTKGLLLFDSKLVVACFQPMQIQHQISWEETGPQKFVSEDASLALVQG